MPTETEEGNEGAITSESEPLTEQSEVSLHIYMPAEEYERVKKWARYAAIEGLIEGHPRGNFAGYCNFCFNLGGAVPQATYFEQERLQVGVSPAREEI